MLAPDNRFTHSRSLVLPITFSMMSMVLAS
jgi:hypothetical protein